MKRKYKIEKIGTYFVISNDKDNKHMTVLKNTTSGNTTFIKINKDIKLEFIRAKKEDKSQENKFYKYIEHSELSEFTLNKRAINKIISAEDCFLQNEGEKLIKMEIWKLPKPQNRRVYMKIVDEMTYSQIARIENVHRSVIKRSVDIGIKKLQKNLQNFYFTNNK